MSVPHFTNFVPFSSSEPPVSEVIKPSMSEAKSVEVTPPRKIRVDLQEYKPKAPNHSKGKLHDKPAWVCHFCGKTGHIRPNYYNSSLYSNSRVGNHSQVNKNSNAHGASKRFWMQKTRPN